MHQRHGAIERVLHRDLGRDRLQVLQRGRRAHVVRFELRVHLLDGLLEGRDEMQPGLERLGLDRAPIHDHDYVTLLDLDRRHIGGDEDE
jgi:hypothetical protein